MADGWGKPLAAVACCALLLGQCSKDPITGTKAAVGGAAIGAGVAGGAAAGAAAGGAAKGLGKRVERKVSGESKPVPNGPSRPLPGSPVTTTTFPVPVWNGIEVHP